MDKPTITLARNKCYVDGQWIGEPKLPVTNKATGDIMARVPDFGEAETRAAIEAANRALPAWSKMLAKERSKLVRRWFDLIDRVRRRAGAAAHQRAGQAAGRGQGRDRLRRGLHRVLRRGGQARLRRDHPDLQGGRPHRRHPPAGRRGGGHHAVEFPRRHDHAQGRPGAGGRLHDGDQARLGDAAHRARAGRAGRAGRHPQGRVQRHHRQGQRDRQGADVQPRRAHAHLHGLDRDRRAS